MSRLVKLGKQDLFAIVDDADYELVAGFAWQVKRRPNTSYATRFWRVSGKRKTRDMHRFLMNPKPGVFVDHINGNGLDNRRCNLRLATPAENSHNMRNSKNQKRGRFKGVYFDNRNGRAKAQIIVQGRKLSIGNFRSPEEAALAYDHVARKEFGAFAVCNYPDES